MKEVRMERFQELVKGRYGEADNFHKVLEVTVPFFADDPKRT